MTERELAEIEARVEAELATWGPASGPDLTHDLLRDCVPRLVDEVRRLQAQVQAWHDGVAGIDRRMAEEIGRNAARRRSAAPSPAEVLESLEPALRAARERRAAEKP